MKKRILCNIIAIIMCINILPMGTYAAGTMASGTCGDNLTWVLYDDGELVIDGTGEMWDFGITYDYSIGAYLNTTPWWKYKSSINTLTLTNGITSIGYYAFYDCNNITGSVIIPDSVTVIKNDAFENCTSLTNIEIGNGVIDIGGLAFTGCSSLESVKLGNSIETIQEGAFMGCTALSNLIMPVNVREIWESAFTSCESLTAINIPGSITKIFANAFSGCNSLIINYDGTKAEWMSIADSSNWEANNSYTINYLGTEILDYTLNADGKSYSVAGIGNSYDNVVIPSTYNGLPVTRISHEAFWQCSSIESVTIPNSIEYIEWGAFLSCSSLADVKIGNGVTDIDGFAFGNCTSLKNVDVGNNIKIIHEAAFSGCTSLESVSISNTLEEIWLVAFENCVSLETINYEGTISQWNSIEKQTDNGNSSWDSYTGDYTIYCTNGTIGKNGTVAYYDVIEGSKGLEYTLNDDGVSYSVTGIGTCTDTDLVIPSTYKGLSVTSIGGQAFSGCSLFTSVTIPDSVTTIGYFAFSSCSLLTSVTIPNTVTIIDESTFINCSSLTEITIPDSVTTISFSAFMDCSSLTAITIPDSVTIIGEYAFAGCKSLKTINYSNTQTYWEDIVKYDTWNDGAGDYTVYCTNGTISKSGVITDNPSNYNITITTINSTISVDDTIYLTLSSNTPFSAAELSFTYDTDHLIFNKSASTLNTATVTDTNGTLTLADYGTEKSSYTLAFDTVKSGTTEITLTSAAFGEAEDAASEDLIEAVIATDTVTANITEPAQNVQLPNILDGDSSVEYGEDYTFSVISDGEYFDYEITATMDGESVEVIDNGDGTYTIENVTGELIIFAERTPKNFGITFETNTGVDLPEEDTTTYGEDYSFALPYAEHYTTTITTAFYVDATGNDVPYSVKDGIVTIEGYDIIEWMHFIIEQYLADATVSVEGNGASDADYEPYATIGEDYTLTLNKDESYDYVVTATVNGESVELTEGEGTYTISADDVAEGSIVFTITKTLKTSNISVSKYLTLDGVSLWLITNVVDKIDGLVYCYDGTAMFWSDEYDAYCTVVASSDKPEVSANNLSLISGAVSEVAYEMDINKSGRMDANDAQFIYNMYNGMYSGITVDITPEKYLRADVNGDGVVNTQDAAAVINKILNIK